MQPFDHESGTHCDCVLLCYCVLLQQFCYCVFTPGGHAVERPGISSTIIPEAATESTTITETTARQPARLNAGPCLRLSPGIFLSTASSSLRAFLVHKVSGQFSPLVDWVVDSTESLFQSFFLFFFCAGGLCEQFWHG